MIYFLSVVESVFDQKSFFAMHSSWETAGVQDYEFLIRAMTEYFGSAL